MCQADCHRTTPRDHRELHNPHQLFVVLVLWIPVAVQVQAALHVVVDADDVRPHAIPFDVAHQRDLVHGTEPVLVVRRRLLAFDLVVGLGRFREVWLRRADQHQITVHADIDTALKLLRSHILAMSLALGGVEVGRRKRDEDIVNRNELGARSTQSAAPVPLHVLHAAKWDLGRQLLMLGAQPLDLLRHLPIHEIGLALGLVGFLFVDLAKNLRLDWSAGREYLFHDASGEVHA